MSDTTPKPPCAICKGGYKEHFDDQGKAITQHVYTQTPGDLSTAKQKQAQEQQQGTRVQVPHPAVLGSNPMATGRLVEVLVEAKVVTPEQALYIAGFGPKPPTSSGFADPAMRS